MIETMNWIEIRTVRNFRPLGERPKEPFSTNAGGNEVMYQAG